MKRIVIFIVLAVAAGLLISSVKIVGTDEVVLSGEGEQVRELRPGLNFLRPFAGTRRFKLQQVHSLAGDDALEISSGGRPYLLQCEVGVELARDRVREIDHDYSDRMFERLLKPILLREVAAFIASSGGTEALGSAGAGPAIASMINEKTGPLGIVVVSLEKLALSERPRAEHGLERADGVKVFILGLDGYDWMVHDMVLKTRDLPNMERVRREGTWGNLLSMEPLISPLIWTTMVTGVTPDVHGITDFLVKDETSGVEIPVTSSMRKVPAIWNITSLFDLTCGFVGWFASYPAEEVQGFVVSDRFAYHMFDPGAGEGHQDEGMPGITYPQELSFGISGLKVGPEAVDEIMPRFIQGSIPEYRTGEDGLTYHDPRGEKSPEDNLRMVISAYRTYEQVMKKLYPEYGPDIFGVYFEFTDSIGHLFMKYMRPAMAGVSPGDEERYGEAIAGAYAEADRILGEVLELIDDSTVLLIVSDHGFKSAGMRPLSDSRMGFGQAVAWHRIRGSIAMLGGPVRRGHQIQDAGVMDIAPTLLYLLGLPVDEKMAGRVLTDALEKTWVDARPITYTSEYDALAGGQALAAAPSAADKALKDKLISLGYVAGGSSALQNLATYYHKNGRFEEALEVWQQLVELEPDNSAARISLGNAYFKTGKDDMAIRVLEDVIRADPSALRALHSLVTIHVERGRAREALEVAERAVRADPNDGWSYYDRGMALELMGRSAEAGDSYRRALELAPDLAEAHANLAQTYASSGRPELALDHARRAVELAGEQPQMLYVLGVALGAGGDQQQALETYYRVIEADSSFVPGYLGACNILLSRGKTDSVLALSSRAVRIPSGYRTYIHSIRAGAHIKRGESGAAVEEYQLALEADPHNVGARINLASLYARGGRRSEAIEHLRRVLDIDPANQAALSLLEQLQ